VFDVVSPRVGALYREMAAGGFLDLLNRPTKAGGGFCNGLPTHGMPFIFGSFAGTHEDVSLLTHEMGHAFQYWATMHSGAGRADGQEALPGQPLDVTPAKAGAHNHGPESMGPGFRRGDTGEVARGERIAGDTALAQPVNDYLWPTAELAEVHSIGLEYLCHPEMERLFGAAAGRFRRLHLIEALAFLPYGAAIDHFQHLVYARPAATAAERHGMWQEVERLYLPWKDWGDLAYPAKGGQWQAKLHVYRMPFYYIDYALAQCCALQLWAMARADRGAAMAAYVGLCERGGSVGFAESVRMAGLRSPFEPGALAGVVEAAKGFLAADGRR
jgi:oligoendopeptidase F